MKKESTNNGFPKGEVVLYEAKNGTAKLDVKLVEETVWLNLMQLTILFNRDKSVISRHIGNIYKEKELERVSTVAKFATVQTERKRKVEREIEFYNLDVIISVGYRVKSQRGTQFRIWATETLRKHLIDGFTINEKRLKQQNEKLEELRNTVNILNKVVQSKQLTNEEAKGLLSVISDYAYALDTLDDYDFQRLKITKTTKHESFKINYDNAKDVIENLKTKFGGSQLFGKEKDNSFKSTVGNIYQTFSKKELYPSIEEKAANLLYMTIKNHSFVDGNKRIAASLFLWYLQKNNYLYNISGEKRIADNALVALCLMIAQSNPKEKDIMIKVIVNLINKNN